jgi:high-affinity iron transporter
VVSYLLYRSLIAIPVARLFAVTGWLIALLAAGMAGQAAAILAGADLIPAWGYQLWDTSWLLPEGSIAGRALHALVGYADRPMGVQVVAWLAVLSALVVGSRWGSRCWGSRWGARWTRKGTRQAPERPSTLVRQRAP